MNQQVRKYVQAAVPYYCNVRHSASLLPGRLSAIVYSRWWDDDTYGKLGGEAASEHSQDLQGEGTGKQEIDVHVFLRTPCVMSPLEELHRIAPYF